MAGQVRGCAAVVCSRGMVSGLAGAVQAVGLPGSRVQGPGKRVASRRVGGPRWASGPGRGGEVGAMWSGDGSTRSRRCSRLESSPFLAYLHPLALVSLVSGYPHPFRPVPSLLVGPPRPVPSPASATAHEKTREGSPRVALFGFVAGGLQDYCVVALFPMVEVK